MTTFQIISLIVLLIDWIFCYLYRRVFYLDDNKPPFSLGVAIIVGLLCLIKILNIGILIAFIIITITGFADEDFDVKFNSKFFEELFTR